MRAAKVRLVIDGGLVPVRRLPTAIGVNPNFQLGGDVGGGPTRIPGASKQHLGVQHP